MGAVDARPVQQWMAATASARVCYSLASDALVRSSRDVNWVTVASTSDRCVEAVRKFKLPA